jgi:hypothetical protein
MFSAIAAMAYLLFLLAYYGQYAKDTIPVWSPVDHFRRGRPCTAMLASSFKNHERHIVFLPGSAAILLLSGVIQPTTLFIMGKIKSNTSDGDSMCPSRNNGSIKHAPLWHSVKIGHKVVGYCFALSVVMLLYGYDFVIVGTVSAMPAFQ